MPLFRKQRGSLADSLETTAIVKNIEDLRNLIYEDWEMWDGAIRKNDIEGFSRDNFDIKIEKYGAGIDLRCGWYTHLVSADLEEKGKFMAIGYLSEPLDEFSKLRIYYGSKN